MFICHQQRSKFLLLNWIIIYRDNYYFEAPYNRDTYCTIIKSTEYLYEKGFIKCISLCKYYIM